MGSNTTRESSLSPSHLQGRPGKAAVIVEWSAGCDPESVEEAI